MCRSNETLPDSVRSLIEAVEEHDHLTPSRAKQLLLESDITTEDLAAWADFEHPACDSYGRKLVYDGGFFELMVMSWVDGDMAAIHDHGYTQWGAVKLFGNVEHAIFRRDGDRLVTAERRMFEPGSVVAVAHDMIHQMGNVGQPNYLTLHLYGSYERDGDVTADARLYSLDEGKIQITSGGVFFGLPEDCISERRLAPETDFPTLLRDRVELLCRSLRTRGAYDQPSLETPCEQRLTEWLFDSDTWIAAAAEIEALADSPRAEHSLDILHQELRAAGRLQLRLIDAGVASGPLADRRDEIAEALAQDSLAGLGASYLKVVGTAHGIDFPLAQAA